MNWFSFVLGIIAGFFLAWGGVLITMLLINIMAKQASKIDVEDKPAPSGKE